MFSRADPDNGKTIIDGDEAEQLGTSEALETTDRAPARVQDMPGDLVEGYARNALQTQEEGEEINVYKPDHEVQEEAHEPDAEMG